MEMVFILLKKEMDKLLKRGVSSFKITKRAFFKVKKSIKPSF